ncbi:hypothetical protein RBSH_03407 [Rhodopirellula baltica SH28]|uniref:Uncharacterized protein n=2 Tax=Rhodopirellula baltica TaxID=265606 RepID=Q7UKK2_RHOBA|nr:hypothetical protein RBSH_03407 [Rhodopirellula baltica SH28]CAD76631.1 hypothetical protein RB10107 [Rhodopirellula baltica SH 1]
MDAECLKALFETQMTPRNTIKTATKALWITCRLDVSNLSEVGPTSNTPRQ